MKPVGANEPISNFLDWRHSNFCWVKSSNRNWPGKLALRNNPYFIIAAEKYREIFSSYQKASIIKMILNCCHLKIDDGPVTPVTTKHWKPSITLTNYCQSFYFVVPVNLWIFSSAASDWLIQPNPLLWLVLKELTAILIKLFQNVCSNNVVKTCVQILAARQNTCER